MMISRSVVSALLATTVLATPVTSFLVSPANTVSSRAATKLRSTASEAEIQKKKLFALIGKPSRIDPVLADPITKEPIEIVAPGLLLRGEVRRGDVPLQIQSPSNRFRGSSNTFLNLLEPVIPSNGSQASSFPLQLQKAVLKQMLPYVPAPLRGPLASLAGTEEFVPMRDLFTNPAVSYAYERGWRQGFQRAGFPGPDKEAKMAMDYFAPVVVDKNNTVLVDMSCATGLFTRRFASTDRYSRVLGCDYSESMLLEARRRINAEPKLASLRKTRLDLVRLDVGQIPMRNGTVDCLHAGAAMHCWPDLDAAVGEIHRVLAPGGRYFATTFLNIFFGTLSTLDNQGGVKPSQRAFQYFESVDTLRALLERGGFEPDKISIEVLGSACVVIRAEK